MDVVPAGRCNGPNLARKPAKANFDALSTSDFPDEAWERVCPDLALLYPSSFHRAKLTGARLERLLDTEATLRNWRTVTKLAERCLCVRTR